MKMAIGLNVEAKIAELGWELVPAIPKANYVSVMRTGNLIYLSGALPMTAEGKLVTGKLGLDTTEDEGYQAARLACLSLLGTLKAEIGNLDNVKAFLKVGGMVNSTPDFVNHPKVMNGCSDLLYELYGREAGRHTRVAAGFVALPLGSAVEIDMMVEVEPSIPRAIPARGQNVEAKIAELGWELVPAIPKANYVSVMRTGNLIFLSGALPMTAEGKLVTGKLGRDTTEDEGYQAARLACLSLLGTLKNEIGSLDKVKAFLKVGGMVNSTPDFVNHPKVMNGCSDLLYELYGREAGRHTRVAAGFVALPLGSAVEIDMIVEVEPSPAA